jgi:hypothetical protein
MSVENVGREIYRILRALVDMPEDSFAIFHVKASSNRFVQFASEGNGALWGEVVSNQFLEPEERLPDEIEDRIVGLGWHPPETPYRAGRETERVNYYREWPTPAGLRSAACVAAVTLWTAFGVDQPGEISIELEEQEEHE